MIIPEEIKEAISALDHTLRWRIVELLQERDESAYTELLGILNIPKGSLTHHLNKLMENGIIDNYSKEEFGGPYSSYYRLSSFGKDLIAGILSSIQIESIIDTKKKYAVPEIPTFETYEIGKYLDFNRLGEIVIRCLHRRVPEVRIESKKKEVYSRFLYADRKIRVKHGLGGHE